MRTLRTQSALFALAMATTLTCAQQTSTLATQPPPKLSHARAARISEIRGDVAIGTGNEANSTGLQRAFANLPIREGTRLQTGLGRAEVEFEDNSTVLLAPYSAVEFPRLELLPSGARATTVHILKGTAYVSLIPAYIVDSRGSEFSITFGQQQLRLQPSSHVRLELTSNKTQPTQAHLAVFDGSGLLEGSPGASPFTKKKTYTFDLTTQSPPTVAPGTHSAPTDKWDQWSAEYHKRTASLRRPPNPANPNDSPAHMPHDIF